MLIERERQRHAVMVAINIQEHGRQEARRRRSTPAIAAAGKRQNSRLILTSSFNSRHRQSHSEIALASPAHEA
jgi:hypothetical protein